jgi:hypothetical protein
MSVNIGASYGLVLVTNITSAVVLKTVPGFIATVSILVAGAAGTINDCTTTGAASAANAIVALPAAVGVISVRGKTNAGIVVTPGAGQTIAVWYS